MLMNRSQWLVTAALVIVAANAWGYSVKPGASTWGAGAGSSGYGDHGWRSADYWSKRDDGGMNDDDSGSGGYGGVDFDRDFGPGGDWFDDILNRLVAHKDDRDQAGEGGHNGWREFVLGDMMAGDGLAAWIDLKKHIRMFKRHIWAKLRGHYQEHHDIKPSPVPLPAPLLLFASGLAGLAGLLRRSKRNSIRD